MTLNHSAAVLTLLTLWGSTSCATAARKYPPVPTREWVRGPFVPAGDVLTVRIVTSVDTMGHPAGQPFVAMVTQALRSPSGVVVVPAGAKVAGTMAPVGGLTLPRLRVNVAFVQTVTGPTRTAALVRHDEQRDWTGAKGSMIVLDDSVYPSDSARWGWWGPIGREPPPGNFNAAEVHVPRGALIQLLLVRPIVPPGMSVP